jgi:hypothetical protein
MLRLRFARPLVFGAVSLVAGCQGQGGPASSADSGAASAASAIAAPSAASVPLLAPDAAPRPRLSSEETRYDFDGDAPDAPPAGFASMRTGPGRDGKWLVRAEDGAGVHAVVQTDTDATDGRFALLVADSPVLENVIASVRCKMIAGKIDRACGIAIRVQDANDYYLARANALEGNVRFYVVEKGKRRELASWSGAVTSGEWHKLRVHSQGHAFFVYWDDKSVIKHADATIEGAGKVALWTKADSVTAFDELFVKLHAQL